MKSIFKVTAAAAGPATIDIEGTIGVPEQWQFDDPAGRVATYEKFSRTLEAVARLRGGEIVVNIRSTGGDVGDALMIHDALEATGATVTTRCHGYVASAATIIAQAASEGRREISASALYLVHNSVGACDGNAAEMERGVELLAQTDRRIAALYARRSGRPEADFAALMGENDGGGRWLAPEEAIAAGLADRVIDAAAITRSSRRRTARMRAAVEADTLRLAAASPRDTAGNLAPVPDEAATREAAALASQSAATPVKLQSKEDPAPAAEGRRSANEIAYRLDAENLRN
jgi:ATP-dependent protease ClpP protease subunit